MSPVDKPAYEGTVTLPDGRDLGFASFGDVTASETIFWLHGTPGARRQIPIDARAYAAEARIRIVGIDRPGIGWSTAHVYDNVLGFAEDLELLADHLSVETMHVVGLSGGGPYTLAAGAAMPDRVTSLGVIGGVAPTVGPDAVGGGLVAVARPLAPAIKLVRRPLGAALSAGINVATPIVPHAIDVYRSVQPKGDRRMLRDEAFRAMFIDDLITGGREQFTAALSDILLFTRDWGFRLADVRQPVRWWHGSGDHIVPFRHGEHVVRRLPNAELIPLDGEAHLGGLGMAIDIIGGIVPGKELIEEVLHADE
jgi:pimeloyl-ACP methyl ester carboxylesterase